jgi:SAM-dependent methyltransferase
MNAPFSQPPPGISFEDCIFYHTIEIPSRGVVRGQWDLRGHVDEYFGGYDFTGKRVLEIGPASGFLTFEMERRGAQVVAVEVAEDPGWDFVPFSDEVLQPILAQRRETMKGVKNSFWFLHDLNGSKAQVHYGDPCQIPSSLGKFDVAIMASVLLHCERPTRILAECAQRADTLIVTETYRSDLEGRSVCRLLPGANAQLWDTWWGFSTNFFVRYFGILGLRHVLIKHHKQHSEHQGHGMGVPFFTIIGSRNLLSGSDQASIVQISDDKAVTEGNAFNESPAAFDLDEEAKAYVCELERQVSAKNEELQQAAQYARQLENGFASTEAALAASAHDVRRLEAVLISSLARQDALSAQVTAIKDSMSWRITEPLRMVIDLCRRHVRASHWARSNH